MNLRLMTLSLVCALTLTAWQPLAPPEPPSKVTARAWKAAADEAAVDIVITAQGFPDLSPTQALLTKEAKTKFVVEALRSHADKAQAQLRADLASRHLDYFPLWISNQIVVKGINRTTLNWLGARADVARVDLDERVKGIEMKDVRRKTQDNLSSLRQAQGKLSVLRLASVEWGVARVNAPQVWAMGYTGQGIVIANLDTGVRWDHNALKSHYRGWNGTTATHDYNWFDAAPDGSAPPSPTPVDVNGHGTHTTGTAVGDDGAGNQIGVAPGTKWIACRNMAGPIGIGSVARYTACFQFALAPTDVNGNNPDPSKGADITSNSWGCDPSFGEVGCEVSTALVTVTQVLRDAGVMVVASAGNDGSACRSVINAPATLDQSFSIGATDSNDAIAGFSSRGPSALTGKVKPDVVAPGVAVRSAKPGNVNDYGVSNGTSMAAPHVAGVVALLWSAAPWLRGDVPATEAILRSTARPLADGASCGSVAGSSVPNNTYGYGLIDAQKAISTALVVPLTTAPATARLAEPITFTLAATNYSANVRTNVVVTSSVPTSAILITSSPPGAMNGNTLSWQFASMAPSSTLTMAFVVSATQPGVLSNEVVQISFDGLPNAIAGKPAATLVNPYREWLPWLAR